MWYIQFLIAWSPIIAWKERSFYGGGHWFVFCLENQYQLCPRCEPEQDLDPLNQANPSNHLALKLVSDTRELTAAVAMTRCSYYVDAHANCCGDNIG